MNSNLEEQLRRANDAMGKILSKLGEYGPDSSGYQGGVDPKSVDRADILIRDIEHIVTTHLDSENSNRKQQEEQMNGMNHQATVSDGLFAVARALDRQSKSVDRLAAAIENRNGVNHENSVDPDVLRIEHDAEQRASNKSLSPEREKVHGYVLTAGKEVRTSDVAAALDKASGTVSDHLKALAESGLIERVAFGTYAAPKSGPTESIALSDFEVDPRRSRKRFLFKPTGDLWPAASVDGRLSDVWVYDHSGNPVSIPASKWLDKYGKLVDGALGRPTNGQHQS